MGTVKKVIGGSLSTDAIKARAKEKSQVSADLAISSPRIITRASTLEKTPVSKRLAPTLDRMVNRLEIVERTPQIGFPQADEDLVPDAHATTSTAYIDLLSFGPTLTIDVTESGKLYVCVSALIIPAPNEQGRMSAELSGDNSVPASSTRCLLASTTHQGSYWVWFEGLEEGQTTVTAKYRTTSGGFAQFSNRSIIAIPI